VLVDKPIIQYAVEEAVNSGLTNLVIITGRGKNAIEDHFDVSFELERILEDRGKSDLLTLVRAVSDMVHIAYVARRKLSDSDMRSWWRGPGGVRAVRRPAGRRYHRRRDSCMRQMMDIYERYKASVVAIMEVPAAEVSRYGIIDGIPLEGNDGRVFDVKRMVEKPRIENSPSHLAIIGRYILTRPFSTCWKRPGAAPGRNPAHRRPAESACAGAHPGIPVSGQALRRGREARVPQDNRGIRAPRTRTSVGSFRSYLKSLNLDEY